MPIVLNFLKRFPWIFFKLKWMKDKFSLPKVNINECPVCGCNFFSFGRVICKELAEDWKLSNGEVEMMNIQQGFYCFECKNNLRAMALAKSLLTCSKEKACLLKDLAANSSASILEINECGNLTNVIKQFRNATLARYPDVDMTRMPYESEQFDFVIHSDTLEHVPDAKTALEECCRVLKVGGTCIFTVPVLMDRLTVCRHGKKKSYHGDYSKRLEDYVVYYEFGKDIDDLVLSAGFSQVKFSSIDGVFAFSIEATK